MGLIRQVFSVRDILHPKLARVTWITHTLGCIGATLPAHGDWKVVVAWLGYILFQLKEVKDKRGHLDAGDYDTPDASGVAPRSDYIGDVLGPLVWALGVTYGRLVFGP